MDTARASPITLTAVAIRVYGSPSPSPSQHLHAGARKRFKAEVVKIRTQFPRIHVKYMATEDGNTAAIALPEMRTAYVHAADVSQRDW